MPMHLNSLTPMRISGTPRSFLNLDSRCPTSIEAVVIGGDLDTLLPTLRVGLVSMNMLSPLSVVARRPPASEGGMRLGGLETSRHPNLLDLPQQAEAATRYRWIMVPQYLKHVRQLLIAALYARLGPLGTQRTNWFTDSVAGSGFDNQGSDTASPFRSQEALHRPC